MAGPLDTIGKAVRANMLFSVVACQCGNTRHYRAIDIGLAVGLGRHPESVRFGCKLCKNPTPPKVSLQMLDANNLPKLTVWTLYKGGRGEPDQWVPQRLV